MNKNICIECSKSTKNPKFCSRSCAATHNNKKYPKRLTRTCKKCGSKNLRKYAKLCDSCNPSFVDWAEVSIGELSGRYSYQRSSRLRSLARRVYLDNFPHSCSNCGYDKIIHVCHIKAIKEFDLSVKVTEVNSLDNLVGLCPNCHWELDHGHLSL